MKRYIFLINMILILLVAITSFSDATARKYKSLDMELIREGAAYGDCMVMNGKGTFEIDYTVVDSLSERTKVLRAMKSGRDQDESQNKYCNRLFTDVFVAFEGKKLRVDYTGMYPISSGKKYEHYWKTLFDGEKATIFSLNATGRNGLVLPQVDIFNDDDHIKRYNPMYYSMTIFGTPVRSFLDGAPVTFDDGSETIEKCRYIGDENQDGMSCHVFRGHRKTSGATLTVWLAPKLMYRPMRYETVSPNGDINVVHSLYKQYDGSIWFPRAITIESYYIDDETAKRVLENRITITLHDFELNTHIPDDVFDLPLPDGVGISDHRTFEYFYKGVEPVKE